MGILFSLLITIFLISCSDSCIPTKTPEPGIPAVTPMKECGALALWDKTTCEASGPTTCQAPSTASATQYACPATFILILNAPTTPATPLNSITCDTAKGEWILESSQGDKKTPKELEAIIPGPYKFYCGK